MAAFAAAALARAQSVGAAADDTLDGVYTTEQAERGRAAYGRYCAGCHREDLGGQNAPPLKGQRFLDQWREFKLEVLFNSIRANMPPRRGGVRPEVADAAYLDIVAFLLQGNELPSGTRELTLDDTAAVRLVGKDGPQPLPSSSLVEVVACFRQISDNAWGLSNASRPVRTLRTDITSSDRDAIEEAELDDELFRLQNLDAVPDFIPEDHLDARVHVKGYLILQPNRERINLTALEVIGHEGCRR